MSDTSDIASALIALLGSDVTLLGYMPNGVYYDQNTPPGSKKFVTVSIEDGIDEAVFGGRAFEDGLYLVKAVALFNQRIVGQTLLPKIKEAALRIDELLDEQTLTVTGYTHMAMFRERPFRETIRDAIDPDLLWEHRGGFYRIQQALIPQR